MGSGSNIFTMISHLASILALGLLISSAQSRIISTRASCPPRPPTKADFDATKYLGNWYQISGLPFLPVPSGTSCIRATYGAKDDGTVSVRNVSVKPDGKTFDQIGGFYPAGDYWVLDTDYDNYASVYACQSILGLFKFEYAWILVRDPNNVSDETRNKALEAFTRNNIDTSAFEEW